MKSLRTVSKFVAGWLIFLATCLAMGYVAAKISLAPQPGEWSVPLRWGPLKLQASVPTLVRVVTAPWFMPWLEGRTITSRFGPVHLSWQETSHTLGLRCAPCALPVSRLGSEPLIVEELLLTLQRQGDQFNGLLSSGKVRASWRASLQKEGLRVDVQWPTTPIADVYALFRSTIPELALARIEGQFGLEATLHLPSQKFNITPHIEAFQVSGLGTEGLTSTQSSCSRVQSRLTPDSWLSHAVVAAEDQRQDDVNSNANANANTNANADTTSAHPSASTSGGSTLSQQLAKLLVTGHPTSAARKLRELLYAVEMENTLGKPRILELYLMHAPWGSDVCGAEAAAQRYFGRRADMLTPSQAAWLAAMLHNPKLEVEHWRSTGHINIARTRWVLQGMRTLPTKQRLRLIEDVAKAKWALPTPTTPTTPAQKSRNLPINLLPTHEGKK